MKKFSVVLLGVLMLALVGCGKTTPQATQTEAEATTVSKETVAPTQAVTTKVEPTTEGLKYMPVGITRVSKTYTVSEDMCNAIVKAYDGKTIQKGEQIDISTIYNFAPSDEIAKKVITQAMAEVIGSNYNTGVYVLTAYATMNIKVSYDEKNVKVYYAIVSR